MVAQGGHYIQSALYLGGKDSPLWLMMLKLQSPLTAGRCRSDQRCRGVARRRRATGGHVRAVCCIHRVKSGLLVFKVSWGLCVNMGKDDDN